MRPSQLVNNSDRLTVRLRLLRVRLTHGTTFMDESAFRRIRTDSCLLGLSHASGRSQLTRDKTPLNSTLDLLIAVR